MGNVAALLQINGSDGRKDTQDTSSGDAKKKPRYKPNQNKKGGSSAAVVGPK